METKYRSVRYPLEPSLHLLESDATRETDPPPYLNRNVMRPWMKNGNVCMDVWMYVCMYVR